MGLIEQAAKRLEELRRAGVEVGVTPPLDQPQPPEKFQPQEQPKAVEQSQPPAVPVPAARIGAEPPAARPAARAPGPVLHIDLARLAAAGFVTPDARQSRIADEFRIIKRPIISNATPRAEAPVKNGNLVMVTSSVPGEGKTFTSVNLAMSIAMELDRWVLLVDGDVARPSLPRTFGFEPGRGLLDVLGSGRDLSESILQTDVPKLSIIRAGTHHPRAAELLASNAMSAVLKELAARYSDRIVIFDSPPLLVTTEARQLASRMGQIIFVVHAERTRQSEVKQALATIEACPVKLLVLNGATTSGQGAYGYGYGYGYGE